MKMKLLKLIVHNRGFCAEDLIINSKDFPGIKKGSIVEIYHPDDEFSRLLLQITCLKEDLQLKETISVEQSIASAFQLRTFADVHVNIVNPENVALDSVELTFKDQYLGRSEMWRLKNNLVNTCVYLNKKIEFCGGSIRCQVYEMWSQGDRVACGVITDDTKVVFRSSTSMVYLFIQMSSEMWDFDIHGDLYFEKAVNGFLADLFQKWKKNGSNHEVTIVLFSRTFYKASNLEEFPGHMRECLQQDYRGRFYEDFYRVAVQNERYEDWTSTLVQLRRLFTDYQKIVLEYHKRPGVIFEKHYLDRSFDRTGQLSVVITPGVGVFEVDRELTNVTKQRIIDNGVGSDLVCVGEQPLHAVPLLKFHNKDTTFSTVDDYSMPHWINLSFYSTNKKVAYSNFIPRIKLPPRRSKLPPAPSNGLIQAAKSKLLQEDECMPNSLFDYDAYDAQVFQLPPVHSSRFSRSLQRMNSRSKKGSCADALGGQKVKRKMSDPDIHHTCGTGDPSVVVVNVGSPGVAGGARSAAISIPQHRAAELSPQQSASIGVVAHESLRQRSFTVHGELEVEASPPLRPVVGSAGSPSNPPQPPSNLGRPGRALINPFDPSHVTIKLTSNRRRWTHIFPKGPTGVLIQQHHYQAVPTGSSTTDHVHDSMQMFGSSPGNDHASLSGSIPRSASQTTIQERARGSRPSSQLLEGGRPPAGGKSLTLLWGATGEQEWTPALTTANVCRFFCSFFMSVCWACARVTHLNKHSRQSCHRFGVDWKSLTIPACLPITTDYFPDKRSLQNDYLVSDYNLLPDDVNADFAQRRAIYKKPLTTAEVFRELVSQRLAQGFQLIVLSKPTGSQPAQTPGSGAGVQIGSSVVMTRPKDLEPTEEYFLSIGRVFHKISLCGSSITVTRYRPRHPYPPFNIHYRYRFHAPHHDTYEVSWVSFTTEKLENFNWNYLDHYICTRGDVDFALAEAQKYWRFRVYVVPLNQQDTKKILDGAEHCDVYSTPTSEEQGHLVIDFLRFIETWVNRIRRPATHKKARILPKSYEVPPELCPPTPRFGLPPAGARSLGPYWLGPVALGMCCRALLCHCRWRAHSRAPAATRQCTDDIAPVRFSRPPVAPLLSPSSLESLLRLMHRSGSKVMERVKADGSSNSGRVSPASEASIGDRNQQVADSSSNDLPSHNDTQDESQNSEISLKSTASHAEILEAMRHPEKGVGFLTQHPSLPSYTFVSADAVQWLIAHVEGVQNEECAVSIMERMLQEKVVCHASGDFAHPFIVGFYLYHVVQLPKDKDGEYLQPLGDLQSFENEWLELEVRHPTGWQKSSPSISGSSPAVPAFLADVLQEKVCLEDSITERDWAVPLYKHTHLEIDINNKSDRVEWGHARYQSVFCPDRAYELVAQWVTSSGPIVADLIIGWARKAQLCGLLMVPIPADPLALPFTHKSDPLRGPIFVPLDTESLMGSKSYLFEEFSEHSWDQRLLLFQEAIIKRFGFIACTVATPQMGSPSSTTGSVAHYHQYVHLTGNVFILISTQQCQPPTRSNSVSHSAGRPVSGAKALSQRRYPVHSDVSSPHEEYITRHVSGKNQNDYSTEPRIGFLWSWNHMVSRRWKLASTATGDEMFQMKILRDFREFCANVDNRLKNFWDSCWNQKQQAIAPTNKS
ncbi:uncharacterized protein GBIM_09784 [Gryllus bimaculatus]|nr:uncharacterized protein GBIM_09784 [Gryllus bimaculatus]